jgi:hypothetical protein
VDADRDEWIAICCRDRCDEEVTPYKVSQGELCAHDIGRMTCPEVQHGVWPESCFIIRP